MNQDSPLPPREAPITLYGHPRSGNVYKVALMLAVTRTPFEFAPVDLPGGATRAPEFRGRYPFGQVPVLEHGDLVLGQSNLILQYLAELTGEFAPANERDRLKIGEWLGFEQDMLLRGVGAMRFLRRVQKADPATVESLRPTAERGYGRLEDHLGGVDWLVGGAASVADIGCYAYAALGPEAGIDLAPYSAVNAWLARVRDLPGFAPAVDLIPVPGWTG